MDYFIFHANQLYRSSKVPVLVADLEGNVVWANDCVQRDFPLLQNSAFLKSQFLGHNSACALEKLNRGEETVIQHSQLPLSFLSMHMTPLCEEGETKGFLATFSTRTADESGTTGQQEADSVQTVGIIDTYVSQLREPLGNVFSLTNPLYRFLKHLPNSAGAISCLNSLKQNAYKLLVNITNISEYTRYLSGVSRPVWKRMELVSHLHELCEGAAAFSSSKSIRIMFIPSEDIPTYVDERRLDIAMMNLLSNSIEHSEQGTTIKVTAKHVGDNIIISVTDEGDGISPSQYNKLFTPYASAGEGNMPGIGHGIGLGVVKAVAAMHGGTALVTSTEGVGTTVSLQFPFRHNVDGLDQYPANMPVDSKPADYVKDRFSTIYIYMASVCPLDLF